MPTHVLLVTEDPVGLSTLDGLLFENIVSFLDPHGATPGTHRAVSHRFVTDPTTLMYLVHDPEVITEPYNMIGAATEIGVWREQYERFIWNVGGPERCSLCHGNDGDIALAMVGVVNPFTFMKLKRIPNTPAAGAWIHGNLEMVEQLACQGLSLIHI